MLLFCQGVQNDGRIEAELVRIERLAADMERILEGAAPETIATEEPPLLDRWILGSALMPSLVGLSTGHPALPGTNRPIATSPVRLISTDMSWVRTSSRWYRLGRPAERSGLNA
jgi:hypothetical protein